MEQNELVPVYSAIERFADFLRSARTRSRYLLSPEIVERIVKEHIGCGVGLDEVRNTLMEEIDEMGKIMGEAGEALFPGTGWREAIRKILLPAFSARGQLGIYRKEADNLLGHCIDRGIVPEDLPQDEPPADLAASPVSKGNPGCLRLQLHSRKSVAEGNLLHRPPGRTVERQPGGACRVSDADCP